ncbi:hypothetical protein H4R19_005167, partial [Coemansia spiralis]
MAKRSGSGGLSVEWDSPERKRLRNMQPLAEALMEVDLGASKEQTCAAAIASLLQQGHTRPLPRLMDNAVHLVQQLKQLNALKTQPAAALFEQSYTNVLDYVGNVVHLIQQAARDNHSDGGDLDAAADSFADVYQYLINTIAIHTE